MNKLKNRTIKETFSQLESLNRIQLEESEHVTAEELLNMFATVKNETGIDSTIIREVYNLFVCADGIPSPYDDDTLFQIVNKNGKLIKRIKKFLKKNGINIDSNISGKLGNQLKNSIKKDDSFYYDIFKVSDGINWYDSDFGASCSCWWNPANGGEGSYSSSIPTFESSDNSYCLRLYNSDEQRDSNGYSRTWLFVSDDAIQIFNAYGIEQNTSLNILLAIFKEHGFSVKFGISNLFNSYDSNIPYINGSEHLVVLDKNDEIQSAYNMALDVIQDENAFEYYCEHCNDGLYEGDSHYINDEILCESCLSNNYTMCNYCNEYISDDDIRETTDNNSICNNCAESNCFYGCDNCAEYTQDYSIVNDTCYCENCIPENEECEDCQERFETENMESIGDVFFCENCNDGIQADSAREELESVGYVSETPTFEEHVANGQQTYFTQQNAEYENLPQDIVKAEVSAHSAKFS